MARIPEPGKGKSTVVVAPRPAKKLSKSDTGTAILGTPARKIALALGGNNMKQSWLQAIIPCLSEG